MDQNPDLPHTPEQIDEAVLDTLRWLVRDYDKAVRREWIAHVSKDHRPRRQLQPWEVIEIRELFARGTISMYALAKLYRCNEQNIRYIVDGKTWTDVGGPIRQPSREPTPSERVGF